MSWPKISCIILEDEPETRKKLVNCLSSFNEIEILGEAETLNQGFELIQQTRPQAAFMDVKVTGGEVFDLLDRLERFKIPLPLVVLVTGFPKYAVTSLNHYSTQVKYFIEKPFLEEWQSKFRKAVDALHLALNHLNEDDSLKDRIKIKEKGKDEYHIIRYEDLVWVEVMQKGSICLFSDSNEGIIVDKTLKKFLAEYHEGPLQQINRETAVNLSKVERVVIGDRGLYVKYQDAEKFFGIGDRYYRALMDRL